jgi:LmbE family N-acetylglucosaminyl deacetylase
MKKNVLICVAHRDDETIGCGGTIYKHFLQGDNVFCLSMTDGVSARSNVDTITKKKIKQRIQNSIKASKILKFKWIDHDENFPDNQLDTVPLISVIQLIEKIKKEVKPTIVYTHSDSDLNVDHRIVSAATQTAFRPIFGEICKKIYAFEVPSSTDYSIKQFEPNYFVNINKEWIKKISALKAYGNEVLKTKTSRSLMGLKTNAALRGYMSGQKFAEAFRIIRELKD